MIELRVPEEPEEYTSNKEGLIVEGDKIYSILPFPQNPLYNVKVLVMDKETFIDCYNNWIPQPEPPEPDPPEPEPDPENPDDPEVPDNPDEPEEDEENNEEINDESD